MCFRMRKLSKKYFEKNVAENSISFVNSFQKTTDRIILHSLTSVRSDEILRVHGIVH